MRIDTWQWSRRPAILKEKPVDGSNIVARLEKHSILLTGYVGRPRAEKKVYHLEEIIAVLRSKLQEEGKFGGIQCRKHQSIFHWNVEKFSPICSSYYCTSSPQSSIPGNGTKTINQQWKKAWQLTYTSEAME